MGDLDGARVVVTGGASGIGLGLAQVAIERGAAAVVLGDIEPTALERAGEHLDGGHRARVLTAAVDVTDPIAMDGLARRCDEELGGVDLVCLNAGVFSGGHAWEVTDDDWAWVLGVNLGGVANGIRSFVPSLIERGSPASVLITASIAGVVAAPVSAPYVTSKFAAVGLAEALHHDLELVGADHVGVSVLCPGMVSTNIGNGGRNRPADLPAATSTGASRLADAGIADAMESGVDPVEGARSVFDQLARGRFYVSTHPVRMWERLVGNENDDRLHGRAPRFQMYD